MIGRREFSVVGLSALGLAAAETALFAQGDSREKDGHDAGYDRMLRSCAEACSDCQRECDSCSAHCAHLLHDGKQQHITTLATCQDCAAVCAAASQIVARGGPFAEAICRVCAEVCAACAQACEKFPDDQHMKKCAEECRECEKACQQMVQHVGRGRQGNVR